MVLPPEYTRDTIYLAYNSDTDREYISYSVWHGLNTTFGINSISIVSNGMLHISSVELATIIRS